MNPAIGWAVGDGGTILKTTDAGAHWTLICPGPDPTVCPSGAPLNAVDFLDLNNGWAVGVDSTILKTIDGGAHWELICPGPDPSVCPSGAFLKSVDFLDLNNGWAVGGGGAILKTTDCGAHWNLICPGPDPSVCPSGAPLNSVVFLDPNNGWAVGANGTILKTTDRGAHWTLVCPGPDPGVCPSGAPLNSVAFHDTASGWVVGGASTILKTTDGGAHWTRICPGPDPSACPSGADLYDLFFVGPTTGWAVGLGSAILKTTDGGVHWTLICPGPDPAVCPSGAALTSFYTDGLKPVAGARSFIDATSDLPDIPDAPGNEISFDIANAIRFMPNANPTRKEPWILLSDQLGGTRFMVNKVAEPQNTYNGIVDLAGDQDAQGNPLPDGFTDILVQDGHDRRTGAFRCLGNDSLQNPKDSFAQCNFRDIDDMAALWDIAVGRIDNDLLDDVIMVSASSNVFDRVFINSGSDTCSGFDAQGDPIPYLGSGIYDEPDGIPCFSKYYNLPSPYTRNPGEKLQAERVKLGRSVVDACADPVIANGPDNLIAVVAGPATLVNGEDPTHGGLRLYLNGCASAETCQAGMLVDVTASAIQPAPSDGFPIIATDVAFPDLDGDGVTDMIVTRDRDESGPNPANRNLFFRGSQPGLNLGWDSSNSFGIPAQAMDDDCASAFVTVGGTDQSGRTEYILIGTLSSRPSCDTRLYMATAGGYAEIALPGLQGVACHNGIIEDLNRDGYLDIVVACGSSLEHFDRLRNLKGARIYFGDSTGMSFTMDSTSGALYESYVNRDLARPRLLPVWEADHFAEIPWDTFLDGEGDRDGHFNAVGVGDIDGDGILDALFGAGSRSGYPRPAVVFAQMQSGVDYVAPAPPGEVAPLDFTNSTTASWPPAPNEALGWNTYRGTIPPGMLGSRPPVARYNQLCFEANDAEGNGPLTSIDGSSPPVGSAFYYLVAAKNHGGEGPLGFASSGNEIPKISLCP